MGRGLLLLGVGRAVGLAFWVLAVALGLWVERGWESSMRCWVLWLMALMGSPW